MPVVLYSVIRLVLVVVAVALLWALGMRGWLVVLVGTVLAFTVAYLAFAPQRRAAGLWLAQRAERRAQEPRFGRAVEEDTAAEDAAADEIGRRSPARGTGGHEG